VEYVGLLVVLAIVFFVSKMIIGKSASAGPAETAAPAGCLSRIFSSFLFWVVAFILVAVVAGWEFFDAVLSTIYAP
jgi:hypothetical protein